MYSSTRPTLGKTYANLSRVGLACVRQDTAALDSTTRMQKTAKIGECPVSDNHGQQYSEVEHVRVTQNRGLRQATDGESTLPASLVFGDALLSECGYDVRSATQFEDKSSMHK